MNCPRCRIPIRAHYRFCPSCGADLDAGPGRGKLRLIAFLLVAAAAGMMIYHYRSDWTPPQLPHKVSKSNFAPAPVGEDMDNVLTPSPSDAQLPILPRQGRVSIYDISGRILAQIPAAVSGGGWVALPAETCLGGFNLTFAPPGEPGAEIVGGVLGDDDEVGVWQLGSMDRFPGPPLFPANLEASLQWIALASEKRAEITYLTVLSQQQNISRVVLPDAIGEPGVFMQDGKLVGWTFGLPVRGYVWTGLDEDSLVMEMTVSDFYRLTFENSREEQFILAHAVPGTQPVQKLTAVAGGFRKKTRLSAEDTPPHLTPAAMIQQMRDLITRLVEEARPHEVHQVFDGNVLAGTGDLPFIEDVVTLVSRSRGFDPALSILADVLAEGPKFSKNQEDRLKTFQRELYLQWLVHLYAAGKFAEGWKVYSRAADIFPHDPEISLQGIRLALEKKDFAAAERLLYAQAYPEDFSEQLRAARARIEALKTPRQAIEIRFAPGSSHVPAEAVIDRRLPQTFVVDTGATMVSIPTQTALKLGYNVNAAPMQTLMTAGGMVRAPKITLESIDMGGWIEYRVPAVVLDLPDKSGVGLLGLNFLNRFRMDLNSREGLLVLHPK